MPLLDDDVDHHQQQQLKIKKHALSINGIHTEIVVTPFADKIFIIVTQFNKLGTIIHAHASGVPGGRKTYSIKVQLGVRDDPLLLVYARQLIERIGKSSGKSLVLAIALKDRSSAAFEAIMNSILNENVF